MSDLTTPWGRLKDTATFLQLVASQGGPLSGNAMEHARRLLVELDLLKAERPEVRAHVPIKVRPMLVSGMLAKDERGPVILLDSEQDPRQQVLTFWHEVLHLVGIVDEVRAEETAMILAGACPTILRAVAHNINVPDSGLDMNDDRLTNNGATRKVDGGTEHG